MGLKIGKLPLKGKIDNQLTEEILTIDSSEYPQLYKILESPLSATIEEELSRLITRFWKIRAERRAIKVSAKLIVFHNTKEVDEFPVIVQDISSSGIRVSVARQTHLELLLFSKVHFLFAVKDGDERRKLNLAAEFIRVAESKGDHMSIAFRFISIDAEETRLLEKGTNFLVQ